MLDRIRQKVFAGDRLTDDELAELRRAAGQQGGPTLRTMVGQALINNDDARTALPLLEAVRRDFPNEAQTHLAVARALASLDKWSEVEAPVQRALQLNPGDPEALKVLAVLALQRGEWARARAWVEQVLEVDPLDTEAQQLSATLAATVSGDVETRPTQQEFLRALTDRLQRAATPHLIAQEKLHLKVGKGLVRLDVDSLYESFLASDTGLAESVAAMASELSERTLGLPRTRLHLLARVLPVLRSASFLDRAEGAAHREGPAGLFVFYVLEDKELVRYLPQAVLAGYRVDLPQLDTAAFRNLAASVVQPRPMRLANGALTLLEGPAEGLWALAAGDGHDAARLLVPAQQEAITKVVGVGPWCVYLGLRELVLLCQDADTETVQRLQTLGAKRDGIEGRYLLADGVLKALPEWAL